MALWPPAFSGALAIPTAFSPVDWHAHELIFGYGGAVVAGFLLTAIPNWTGRLPVAGAPLAGLAALWAAGRSPSSPRPRSAARPRRLSMSGFSGLRRARGARSDRRPELAESQGRRDRAGARPRRRRLSSRGRGDGARRVSIRAALGLLVMLILLVGGRVTPSFTGNWIARGRGRAAGPVRAGRRDRPCAVRPVACAWVAAPEGVGGLMALAVGAANLSRLSRWRGLAARRDALVLVLHAGYFFAALGFLAVGRMRSRRRWCPTPRACTSGRSARSG